MSGFGDIGISKTVNHIRPDMIQFRMIEFSDKWLSKIIFSNNKKMVKKFLIIFPKQKILKNFLEKFYE